MRDGDKIKSCKQKNVTKQALCATPPHRLYEDYLRKPWIRKILKFLATGPNSQTPLENIFYSYRNDSAKLIHKIKYAPLHKAIDYGVRKAECSQDVISDKIFHRQWAVRVLVNAARSVGAYGLTEPQRFSAPLTVVWNLTNRCNLACKHCYLDSGVRAEDELSRSEKIAIIDQLSENYVPILVLAGGEPFLAPDLWAVLERSQEKRIYCMIATNGTLLTPENCKRLVALGVDYVEVSLDSPDPGVHDEFRRSKGCWERSVQGIRNAVQTPGLECGIATCFIKDTVAQAQNMLNMAISLGATRFLHFNFLPIGRAALMADQELDSNQQEQLMDLLRKTLEEGKIEVWSTAPQFGRIFLNLPDFEKRRGFNRADSSKWRWANIFSKYMGGCGGRRRFCAIQPDGSVSPCVSMPHNSMGDLRVSPFSAIWNPPDQAFKGDRDGWKDNSSCQGCRPHAENFKEDPESPDLRCPYSTLLFSRMQNYLAPIGMPV
jgi:radical SAM protein with 4Fe4S-binding SPASM domain